MSEHQHYIRIMEDPWGKDPTRKYAKHNLYTLTNKVFPVTDENGEPTDDEMVSIVDGSKMTCPCYHILRDDFLRICPQFEDTALAYPGNKYVLIPASFAVSWFPEGRFVNGKSTGLEEGVRKSKRWVEEAKRLGIDTNPFVLKDSRWV